MKTRHPLKWGKTTGHISKPEHDETGYVELCQLRGLRVLLSRALPSAVESTATAAESATTAAESATAAAESATPSSCRSAPFNPMKAHFP